MKKDIRKSNKIKRAGMAEWEVKLKSSLASKIFLSSDIYKNCFNLMLYMPLGNETDNADIIKAAFTDGKNIIFPVTDAVSGEITPYYATGDTEFYPGAFSVYEPYGTEAADVSSIDVILVPGIAFDKKGVRVGFGKGCYDRFLMHSSAVKVGFCYDFQICEEISADECDINMDYLVTESSLIDCRNGGF